MRRVMVRAYAKINLALDVLGRRDDGFHEVKMVMQGINLYDQVELTLASNPEINLECPYPETGPLTENLAYRAARLFQQECGVRQGIEIKLQKNIPVAAGLAGGSADGAAVLLGLNTLWGLRLSQSDLQKLAEKLGSDVPFCLWPATVLAQGRGELITEVLGPTPIWLVLCKPPYGASTAQVYQNLLNVNILKRPNIQNLLTALAANDWIRAYPNMANVLEYSTFALFPELREQAQELERLGGCRVMMTGSGPTLMAFTRGEQDARELAENWPRKDWKVIVTRTLGLEELRERVELYEGETFTSGKS